MSSEAEEHQRRISVSVRDMLPAYRIQASGGPVIDRLPEQILFRAAHGVVHNLAPYQPAERVALLSSVVRVLLAIFLEAVAGTDGVGHAR